MTGAAPASDTSFVATRLPALIGAGFGLLFLLINAGSLPAPWPLGVRVAGVLLTAAVAARVLTGAVAPAPRPGPSAMRTYWRWVGIEGIAIVAGTFLLGRFGLGEFGVLWVIAVVGVHFLPFATAFGHRAYAALGWVLIALALVGAVLAILFGATGSGVAGVTAGVVLLVFAAAFGRARR
ncbi:hypothetical protein [Ruania zhangjianzhongii]|uniref:hypothetical protein n=1 Tax=Ruania zhangjianzhongii TaxID=2603206 RepID=UPI0011C90418|nr:hypothetical protein [Ruania zhangjianzhongii]